MLGSYQNWFEAALYQLWKSALMQMIIHGVFRYNALFQGRVHPVDQVYPMEHAYAFAMFASCLFQLTCFQLVHLSVGCFPGTIGVGYCFRYR